jgi:Uma2 family endonuclease
MTVAELLEKLGGIPPERVRLHPPPGTATEEDLLAVNDHEESICELVDGVLVDKPLGFPESVVAVQMVHPLYQHIAEHDLGILAGAAGPLRLRPGLVRIPDVSFVSWDQLPRRKVPLEPIPDLYPDLAVEVLSAGNTKGEMERKRREYFLSGTRLVWLVDLQERCVRVYTSPDRSRLVKEDQTLNGGDVLPGLSLPVRQVFERMSRSRPRRRS